MEVSRKKLVSYRTQMIASCIPSVGFMAVCIMLYINCWRVPRKDAATMCTLGIIGAALCGGAGGWVLTSVLPVPDTIAWNIAFFVLMSYLLPTAFILWQYILCGKFFRPAMPAEKTSNAASESAETEMK